MKSYYLNCFFSLMLLSPAIFAAGDIASGKAKTATCVACHGANGASINPEWPNLAGQHADYIAKQLRDYRGGTARSAALMAGFVASLSDKDIEDLAAFYGSLPPLQSTNTASDNKRGQEIYRRGDMQQKITACIACHGPTGVGNAQAGFPVLAAQNTRYTVLQLQAFKTQQRRNDLNGIMHDISSRMTDSDMQAVAEYIWQLQAKP